MGQHFYLPDGQPFYQVPYADPRKGLRDANLKDAKKVGAYPSVTTVMDIPRKPALEIWKENQAVWSALTYPHLTELLAEIGPEAAIKKIRADSQEQVKAAAERGTSVHDALEAYYKDQPWAISPKHYETVNAAAMLIEERCGLQDWEAEKHFAHPLGFGGKIDLISADWIIDFKTKDGDAMNHQMYDEQLMQLVAYDLGTQTKMAERLSLAIQVPVFRCKANVIVSRDIPGSVHFWEWPDDHAEQVRQWSLFYHYLQAWRLQNRYEL